jgi:PKD repeat protein
VRRSGCKTSDTLNILVHPLSVANFSFSNSLLNVSFSNTALYYDSLYWDFGDGSPFNSTLNPSHTFAQNGIYTACLHTYNSCGVDSVCKTINLSTVGIQELQQNSTFIKNSNGYQLFDSKPIGNYAVYDLSGRCVFQSKESNNTVNLDLTAFEKGCYLLYYQLETKPKKLKLIW